MSIFRSSFLVAALCSNTAFASSGFAIKTCESIIRNFNQGYASLYIHLNKKEKQSISSHSRSILNSTPQGCSIRANQNDYHQLIVRAIRSGSRKVAILLNTSEPFAKESRAILRGIYSGLSYMEQEGIKKNIKILDTSKSDQNALAKAILIYNSDLVIAKIDSKNIDSFKATSNTLRTPIIMMNNGQSFKNEMFSFFVYPHKKTLAAALENLLAKHNSSKIAVLAPNNIKSDIVEELQRSTAKKMHISAQANYNNSDFKSLDAAIQKLLSIDYNERADEFRKLVALKEKEALDKNEPFRKDQVFLPPKYDFDSIYIADNFRVARHVAKILKFYGIEKMALIGNSSWRDISLVKPYDKFFDQSSFIDFIGLYSKLPFNVKQQNKDGTLLSAAHSEHIDYKLMGYRASTIVASALTKRFSTKAKLAKILRHQVLPKDVFFKANKAFDRNSRSIWPAFAFHISEERIEVIYENNGIMFAQK